VDAALHNFEAVARAGGPQRFFRKVASKRGTTAKIRYLADHLKYKKKGCRDILIELRLASDCVALDQRIKNILKGVGVKISVSVNKQYEQIEQQLIEKVAKPSGLTGGQLDRILFQNYGDIMVRLLCP
jgi:tetraacyldisaccharide-1-P 4'-kinase